MTVAATNETLANARQPPVTIIQPSKGWLGLNLRELWEYRELLYFFVWRDVKVRYKQTAIGGAWAVLQPLSMMVVFSVVFGRFLDAPSQGLPYPVFAYAALLPWQLFSHALTSSGATLVTNRQLVTRVYFPRVIMPASAVLVGLVDFAVAFILLLGLMLYFGIVPTVALATLPLFVTMALATALGVGLWLSALNAMYRDVQYVLPFLAQIWLYASPVAYSSTLIPEQWRFLFGLNPMAGVIEGFRWALLGAEMPSWGLMGLSVVLVLALLVSGLLYFRRVERTFADVI